jgi:hypothetical protein
MLKLVAILLLIAISPTAAQTPTAKPKGARNEQLNPKVSKPVSQPCAQYGAGFVRVPGTDSCVRMGGSVETSVGLGSSGGR